MKTTQEQIEILEANQVNVLQVTNDALENNAPDSFLKELEKMSNENIEKLNVLYNL